jgi:hypothetical protein
MMVFPCRAQLWQLMSPSFYRMFPKQKAKHLALSKLYKAQQVVISKGKKNRMMLVIFFISQGIIHKEFVPRIQIVNKEYYVEIVLFN